MQKLWIYGAGGHAAVVSDIIESLKDYEITGLIDDDENKKGKKFYSYTIVGDLQKFNAINNDLHIKNMFLAIGDNSVREKLYSQLSDFIFPTIIHSSAIIGRNVEIGSGTIVMPGVIIEAQAKIGKQCIINNHAIIGHGNVIDDFCHIGGGAILSGQISVGKGTLIGIGSCITPKTRIGKKCLIGAGSIISKDVPNETFVMGKPGRAIGNYLSYC